MSEIFHRVDWDSVLSDGVAPDMVSVLGLREKADARIEAVRKGLRVQMALYVAVGAAIGAAVYLVVFTELGVELGVRHPYVVLSGVAGFLFLLGMCGAGYFATMDEFKTASSCFRDGGELGDAYANMDGLMWVDEGSYLTLLRLCQQNAQIKSYMKSVFDCNRMCVTRGEFRSMMRLNAQRLTDERDMKSRMRMDEAQMRLAFLIEEGATEKAL